MHGQYLRPIVPIYTRTFVDDTTLQEIIKATEKIQGSSFMQQTFDEMQTWTNDNSMNLNHPKTKEMLTSFVTTNPPQITPIQINGEAVCQGKKYQIPWNNNIR